MKSGYTKIMLIVCFMITFNILNALDQNALALQLLSFSTLKQINEEGLEANALVQNICNAGNENIVLRELLDIINQPQALYSLPHDGFVLYNKYNTFTFSDDGRYFFDGTKLIESKTGIIHTNEKEMESRNRAILTSDGQYIISAEANAVKVFNVPSYELVYTIKVVYPALTVSPDNTKLVINNSIYDLATGAKLLELSNSKLIDGKKLIFSAIKPIIISSYITKKGSTRWDLNEHPKLGVYNSNTGELIATLLGEHASISPDEKFLVTSYLSTIYIYSTDTFECLYTIKNEEIVDTFIFDNLSNYFIAFWSSEKSNGFKGYSLNTGKEICSLKKSILQKYAISNDAQLVLHCSDRYNDEKLAALKDHQGNTLMLGNKKFKEHFYFSPTGKYAVACDHCEALLYNTITKKEVACLPHEYYRKEQVFAFSPQEDLLITFHQDKNYQNNITMWDIQPVKADQTILKEVLAFLVFEACEQNTLDINRSILERVRTCSNPRIMSLFDKRREKFNTEQMRRESERVSYLKDYNNNCYQYIYENLSSKEGFMIKLLIQKYLEKWQLEEPELFKEKSEHTNNILTQMYQHFLLKALLILPYRKKVVPSYNYKTAFSDIKIITSNSNSLAKNI